MTALPPAVTPIDETLGALDDLVHQGKVVLSGSLEEVRSSFGKNTLQLEFEGDGSFLETLPNVVKANMHDRSAELTLSEAADPQAILQAAAARLRIRRFEVASPSLEEIFIEKVGSDIMQSVQPAEVMR